MTTLLTVDEPCKVVVDIFGSSRRVSHAHSEITLHYGRRYKRSGGFTDADTMEYVDWYGGMLCYRSSRNRDSLFLPHFIGLEEFLKS